MSSELVILLNLVAQLDIRVVFYIDFAIWIVLLLVMIFFNSYSSLSPVERISTRLRVLTMGEKCGAEMP